MTIAALAIGGIASTGIVAFAPYATQPLRTILAGAFAAGLPLLAVWIARRRIAAWRRIAMLAIAICGAIIAAFLMLARPSNERPWSADQARLARIERDGDRIRIANVRNFTYRSTSDYIPAWETRDYDLSRLETLWFVVEPFSSFPGAAHTFLSFGFAGGDYLAVSVEIRKEQGESFSPWRGLFRNYELMYVFGDERDLIRLRTEHRRDTVYVYPVKATPAQIRTVFTDILQRAETLAEAPEFYNTATSNCTTNIARHANAISPGLVPFSWQMILPGHSDALALQLGLIDFQGGLEEARRRFRVNARGAGASDGVFSESIRAW